MSPGNLRREILICEEVFRNNSSEIMINRFLSVTILLIKLICFCGVCITLICVDPEASELIFHFKSFTICNIL
ncbi:unnamed protein product [Moneuplotes crassus]|uniref:Uncharacterized protein n=1 Tax=Euplotes crassus TaxID=5936 RepID=A0AAD2D9I3_EUPCR|nr:unnamed protein product [Moneuplotes crassus]